MHGENNRQEENQTATFNHPYEEYDQGDSEHLSPIKEQSEEDHIDNSMTMPQTLLDNILPTDNEKEFQPPKSQQQPQLNMTFNHPQPATFDFDSQQPLERLRLDNSRLKVQMVGLNEMISEMVDKKNDILNQYEVIVSQKKVYKRLSKSLNDEYEGYLSMMQADYQFNLEEELEIQSKRHSQLKKEVQALNYELSKPMIKDFYEEDMKKQKIERELYETKVYLEQLRVNNEKRRNKTAQIYQNIKDKENALKKINKKISKYQQECEEEEFISKEEESQRKDEYEKNQGKVARLRKIVQHGHRKLETEYNRKVKMVKEKEIVLSNMEKQVRDLSDKILKQEKELQKSEKNKKTLEEIEIPSFHKSEAKYKFSTYCKQISASTPKTNSGVVGNQFQRFRPLISSKTHSSHTQSASSQPQSRPLHLRTFTETSQASRLQLNLRKKKIYTQLQKNQYFKRIQCTEHQKHSRVVQPEETTLLADLQNLASPDLKFPGISKQKSYTLPSESQSQPIDESIIQQARFISVEDTRKNKKKSIQMHNHFMKQLRNNRKKLNAANYEQLCKILKRDRLLIEEDCGYELSELIYNSRF